MLLFALAFENSMLRFQKIMKTLDEIKRDFEHRSYLHRGDFIDEYDFNDPFHEYYRTFIIKAAKVKNHLYLSDLIDLARFLSFFDDVLFKRYSRYLFARNHYLVKLSCLDYLLDSPQFYKDKESERKLVRLVESKSVKSAPAILKTEIYLNLLALGRKASARHLEELKQTLSEAEDWRTIYRILNRMNGIEQLRTYRSEMVEHIRGLHEQKDFGPGVTRKLNGME